MRFVEFNDQEFTRGQKIDWEAFKANLGKIRIADNVPDFIDGVLWLGMAGDPDHISLFNSLNKPAKIDYDDGGLKPFGDREAARFTPGTGTITVNSKWFPTWDKSTMLHGVLAHEFRHRGFHIIRRSDLINYMPSEAQEGIKRMDPRKTSLEHQMIYSMDGKDYGPYFDSEEERRRYQKLYKECATAAADWIQTGPLPNGVPQALEKEFKRAYGED